jgi:hypothetical protein
MQEPSLDQLFLEAGPAAPRLKKILTEAALNLLESRLLVRDDLWHRVSQNDAFALEFLTKSLGAPKRSWDVEEFLGQSALPALRAVNQRAHAYSATTGAVGFSRAVARAQGGEFCTVCGKRERLHVDHIMPVSVGGIADLVTNMQLLCRECNLGKSNLKNRLLPVALAHNTTRKISAGLRFKHLLLDSVEVDGRTRGVCSCGQRAESAELEVTVASDVAAANLLSLITRCKNCDQGSRDGDR